MILVSGFTAFDGDADNSTELIINKAKLRARGDVKFTILPVSFKQAWPCLKAAIDECSAETVIALGQAGKRQAVSLERVALNWIDARIADNDGEQPIDRPIQTLGPMALPARLPTRQLMEAMRTKGLPVELSYSAGEYVCNALMYELLYWAEKKGRQAGFVHFPRLSSEFTLDQGVLALETIVSELV